VRRLAGYPSDGSTRPASSGDIGADQEPGRYEQLIVCEAAPSGGHSGSGMITDAPPAVWCWSRVEPDHPVWEITCS
jgi:hypothetical protein